MNIKEFREYLAQFPDDTIVEVVRVRVSGWSQVGEAEVFDENDGHFMDFTGRADITPNHACYNKKFLQLGST